MFRNTKTIVLAAAVLGALVVPATAQKMPKIEQQVKTLLALKDKVHAKKESASSELGMKLDRSCLQIEKLLDHFGSTLRDDRRSNVINAGKALRDQAEDTREAVEDWRDEIMDGNDARSEADDLKQEIRATAEHWARLGKAVAAARNYIEDEVEKREDREKRLRSEGKPLWENENSERKRVDDLMKRLVAVHSRLKSVKRQLDKADVGADRIFVKWQSGNGNAEAHAQHWGQEYERVKDLMKKVDDAIEESASLSRDYERAISDWTKAYRKQYDFFRKSEFHVVYEKHRQAVSWLWAFNELFPRR